MTSQVRRTMLVSVLAVALAVAGCGSSNSDSTSTDSLAAGQANADVAVFCRVVKNPREDKLDYGKTYVLLTESVQTLIRTYKENPNLEVYIDAKNPKVPVKTLVQNAIIDLKKCGADGRQQSKRLQLSTRSA